MQYQAVLFDFDYTLGDATGSIVAGFQYAFEKLGHPMPQREAVRGTVGLMLEDAYSQLSGDSDPARAAAFRSLYREKAGPTQVMETRLLPGAAKLLRALHQGGVPTAVVSSKGTQTLRDILAYQGVLEYVSSVTGGDAVENPKPHPEGLLAAVAALGIAPGEVLFCGDTIIDAETAQRAGTHFCAVLNGTTGADAFAAFPYDYIALDLIDLRDWLALQPCNLICNTH